MQLFSSWEFSINHLPFPEYWFRASFSFHLTCLTKSESAVNWNVLMDPGNSLAWNSYRVNYFDITFLTTWLDVFIAKKESVGKVLAFVEWVVALFGCRNYLAMARNLLQNFRQYFSSSFLWYSFLQNMLHPERFHFIGDLSINLPLKNIVWGESKMCRLVAWCKK